MDEQKIEEVKVENIHINLVLVQTKEDGKIYVTCNMSSIPPNQDAILSPTGLAIVIHTLLNKVEETIPENEREKFTLEHLMAMKKLGEYATKLE